MHSTNVRGRTHARSLVRLFAGGHTLAHTRSLAWLHTRAHGSTHTLAREKAHAYTRPCARLHARTLARGSTCALVCMQRMRSRARAPHADTLTLACIGNRRTCARACVRQRDRTCTIGRPMRRSMQRWMQQVPISSPRAGAPRSGTQAYKRARARLRTRARMNPRLAGASEMPTTWPMATDPWHTQLLLAYGLWPMAAHGRDVR